QKENEGGRFDQATAEVVENLPTRNQRDRVWNSRPRLVGHRGEKPSRNLPVAAQPAVFAPIVGAVMGRVILDQFHVAGRPGARVCSLNQIGAEHSVAWETTVEPAVYRIDLVNSF